MAHERKKIETATTCLFVPTFTLSIALIIIIIIVIKKLKRELASLDKHKGLGNWAVREQ